MAEIFEIAPGLYQGSHPYMMPVHIEAVLNVDYTPARYRTDKLKYVHMPIIDGPDPGQEWLEQALNVLGGFRTNKLKTFVHCQAGMSRSVFVTAALLIREAGITRKEAINLINSKTNFADPAPAFLLALDAFYTKENVHAT